MKKRISKILVPVGVIAIVAVVIFLFSQRKPKEEISFETVKVETGNIQNSITATGTIEPVASGSVGTQVSGIVSKLYVDYNSVIVYEGSENLMNESHSCPCGRVVFDWRNYKK